MRATIKEFNLTQKEQGISQGTSFHKYNHVAQNIKLASNIREFKNIQHSFKRSVLSKSN